MAKARTKRRWMIRCSMDAVLLEIGEFKRRLLIRDAKILGLPIPRPGQCIEIDPPKFRRKKGRGR